MFDPFVGRWMQDDPEGFAAGDMNLYRFVGNSPTNKTDPTGLDDKVQPPPGPQENFIDKKHPELGIETTFTGKPLSSNCVGDAVNYGKPLFWPDSDLKAAKEFVPAGFTRLSDEEAAKVSLTYCPSGQHDTELIVGLFYDKDKKSVKYHAVGRDTRDIPAGGRAWRTRIGLSPSDSEEIRSSGCPIRDVTDYKKHMEWYFETDISNITILIFEGDRDKIVAPKGHLSPGSKE